MKESTNSEFLRKRQGIWHRTRDTQQSTLHPVMPDAAIPIVTKDIMFLQAFIIMITAPPASFCILLDPSKKAVQFDNWTLVKGIVHNFVANFLRNCGYDVADLPISTGICTAPNLRIPSAFLRSKYTHPPGNCAHVLCCRRCNFDDNNRANMVPESLFHHKNSAVTVRSEIEVHQGIEEDLRKQSSQKRSFGSICGSRMNQAWLTTQRVGGVSSEVVQKPLGEERIETDEVVHESVQVQPIQPIVTMTTQPLQNHMSQNQQTSTNAPGLVSSVDPFTPAPSAKPLSTGTFRLPEQHEGIDQPIRPLMPTSASNMYTNEGRPRPPLSTVRT